MSFYWYDFETFGADPLRDRPCQFAGIRTDENFNEIDEPLVIYCKPTDDMLPQPEACLITGITPQEAASKGVVEAEFIGQIEKEFSRPGTCVVGYNSIRFDDEVTRHCLYRNFHDPYAREWQQGNSRWDIIDMVRLVRATRPQGICWPDHENGKPSFKLEALTRANGLVHDAAHDALSDVRATIAMARLVREKQPRLFDYVFNNRSKKDARSHLDLRSQKPVLHISSKYPAEKGCAALVVPLVQDLVNANAVYVYDLSVDPQPLLELSAQQIRERVFTAAADLPEGVERIPLKAVHVNKCPILVPASILKGASAERLGIDLQACLANLNKIRAQPGLSAKIKRVFQRDFPPETNPDLMLYSGGFFSNADKQLMVKIRTLPQQELASFPVQFDDARIPEMLFRYRARNYPLTLDDKERLQWREFCRDRLEKSDAGASITMKQYVQQITDLRQSGECTPSQLGILDQLDSYAKQLWERVSF